MGSLISKLEKEEDTNPHYFKNFDVNTLVLDSQNTIFCYNTKFCKFVPLRFTTPSMKYLFKGGDFQLKDGSYKKNYNFTFNFDKNIDKEISDCKKSLAEYKTFLFSLDRELKKLIPEDCILKPIMRKHNGKELNSVTEEVMMSKGDIICDLKNYRTKNKLNREETFKEFYEKCNAEKYVLKRYIDCSHYRCFKNDNKKYIIPELKISKIRCAVI